MIYRNYKELVFDYCDSFKYGNEIYERHIKPHEKALKKWFKKYKRFDIHFCDPANAIFCYDFDKKHHGFDLDDGVEYE